MKDEKCPKHSSLKKTKKNHYVFLLENIYLLRSSVWSSPIPRVVLWYQRERNHRDHPHQSESGTSLCIQTPRQYVKCIWNKTHQVKKENKKKRKGPRNPFLDMISNGKEQNRRNISMIIPESCWHAMSSLTITSPPGRIKWSPLYLHSINNSLELNGDPLACSQVSEDHWSNLTD